jgi:hypothetical protein
MPVNNLGAGKDLFKERCFNQLFNIKKSLEQNDALNPEMKDRITALEGRIRRYSDANDYQVINEQMKSLQKDVDSLKKPAKPIAMKEIPSYLREEKVVSKKSCCGSLFARKTPTATVNTVVSDQGNTPNR